MAEAFTPAALAREWGVSARTVYTMVASGELGHIRVRSLIRIRQADKEAYEARTWHAPAPTDQTIPSPSAAVVSMSHGGKMAGNTAFQRGRQIGPKQPAT